jgi:hypothetical protein
MAWTGYICIRIETVGGLLLRRYWILHFLKMQGLGLAEGLLIFQEEACWMEPGYLLSSYRMLPLFSPLSSVTRLSKWYVLMPVNFGLLRTFANLQGVRSSVQVFPSRSCSGMSFEGSERITRYCRLLQNFRFYKLKEDGLQMWHPNWTFLRIGSKLDSNVLDSRT